MTKKSTEKKQPNLDPFECYFEIDAEKNPALVADLLDPKPDQELIDMIHNPKVKLKYKWNL